jgi:DNA topoisomerase-1
LLEAYEEGNIEPYLEELRAGRNKNKSGELHNDEKVLLQFMEDQKK